jgi:hypothetical protein
LLKIDSGKREKRARGKGERERKRERKIGGQTDLKMKGD